MVARQIFSRLLFPFAFSDRPSLSNKLRMSSLISPPFFLQIWNKFSFPFHAIFLPFFWHRGISPLSIFNNNNFFFFLFFSLNVYPPLSCKNIFPLSLFGKCKFISHLFPPPPGLSHVCLLNVAIKSGSDGCHAREIARSPPFSPRDPLDEIFPLSQNPLSSFFL